MREARTARIASLDFDTRRLPKTSFSCVACQKDMRPDDPRTRWVHLVNGGLFVLHPRDEPFYVPDRGDMGCFPIGPDCARKLGMEWSTALPELAPIQAY